MKFSLILATMGRIDEVEMFIKSLLIQTYKNFELIIVDQNNHDKIKEICLLYKNQINIKYIKIKPRGLSNARNMGMRLCTGDIISFPDDDCEYYEETLHRVHEKFKLYTDDIVTFKIIDKDTKLNTCGNWLDVDTSINKKNIFNTAISITIFVKNKKNEELRFDENLGVGTRLSSGEETDFILELLNRGYKGTYYCDIYVYHPQKEKDFSRGYNYALGTGAVYYKESIGRKNYKYIFNYFKSIIGSLIRICTSLIKGNIKIAKYNKSVLKGRIDGFFEMKKIYEELI